MADAPSMKIDLPGVDFTQLARQTIAAKLTESMLGSEDVIQKIVIAAMSRKVTERGVVSQYDYENRHSFVEWLAQDMMRTVVVDVLRAKVEALRPVIEKQVEVALRRDVKSIANALTESFIGNAKSAYGVTVSLSAEFKRPER